MCCVYLCLPVCCCVEIDCTGLVFECVGDVVRVKAPHTCMAEGKGGGMLSIMLPARNLTAQVQATDKEWVGWLMS